MLQLLLAQAALAVGVGPAAPRPLVPRRADVAHSDGQGLVVRTHRDLGPASGQSALSWPAPSVAWSVPSDGSWIAEAVSVGDRGARVFAANGSYVRRVEAYTTQDPAVLAPTPVWSSASTDANYGQVVASAEEADVHASLHERALNPGLSSPVLEVRTGSSAAPVWSHDIPVSGIAPLPTQLELSDDGTVLVAVCRNSGGAFVTVVDLLPGPAGTPVGSVRGELQLQTLGEVQAAVLSRDGSTLALSSQLRTMVLDLATLETRVSLLTPGTQNTYGALDLSADGALVAFGTAAEIRLLRRDAGGAYAEDTPLQLGADEFCRRLALSASGERLALGLQVLGDLSSVRAELRDLGTGETLVDHEWTGGGALQNLVSAVELSAQGDRLALGVWGDEHDLVPEVSVFHAGAAGPALTHFLPGSVLSMDLSGSGHWLTVASKGTHANVMGGGGELTLLLAGRPDLLVEGVARPGATITLRHLLREGSTSRIFRSDELAAVPVTDSPLGSGALELDPATLQELPGVVQVGPGEASLQLTLPADPQLVGTTFHVQALREGAQGGTWSNTSVRVRIAP